ncbi:Hint domain-containing protein [Cognatishimia sp. D5M38]|uniref:Hint domain-containing protein n=1 Tax=Cognatishimia coralii TaxID=3083254 RepID=A0ABU8QG55_9RHOB
MGTGFLGTFVISWSQTELDGLRAAPISAVQKGAVWSWNGETVRVDGPSGLLRLEQGEGEAMLRRRAARMVRKMVGAALTHTSDLNKVDIEEPMLDDSFVVTDGAETYTVTLIEVAGKQPLLMFIDEIPPKGRDLWVVYHALNRGRDAQPGDDPSQMICFAPGTLISTPYGARPIESLHEGDLVHTKDNGTQEVQWIGSRRMTGARLFTFPKLRPIRVKSGALGSGEPQGDLIVSPDHKFVVRGDVARDLFNTPEVLVSASELVNGTSIATDFAMREVTYMHLMLERHEIIFANGVETESFHPADANMSVLDETDRQRLEALDPALVDQPYAFGDHARRQLSASEAAILRHDVA